MPRLLEEGRTAEHAGRFEVALNAFEELAAMQPNNPQWPLESVRVLMQLGRDGEAADAFARATARWPGAMADPGLRALIPGAELNEVNVRNALGDHCPPDAALRRTLLTDDGGAQVQVVRGGRPIVMLVFTGLADRLIMPLSVFDRYLAELDVSAIYLRDRLRLAFMGGMPHYGPTYEDAVAGLRKETDLLGAAALHTLGNSAGGLAAISYGLDLGAASILGFAAPTDVTDEAVNWDLRSPRFNLRMRDNVPAARRDLRPRLLSANPRPPIDLWFGEGEPLDVRHARHLEEVQGVRLHPVAGLAAHGALFEVARNGDLRKALRERGLAEAGQAA